MLQKFLWSSSAVELSREPTPFWATVSTHLSRGHASFEAVKRVSRSMLHRGLSVKQMASMDLWRGILVEGEFEGGRDKGEGGDDR